MNSYGVNELIINIMNSYGVKTPFDIVVASIYIIFLLLVFYLWIFVCSGAFRNLVYQVVTFIILKILCSFKSC